jgi:hypothetical protein
MKRYRVLYWDGVSVLNTLVQAHQTPFSRLSGRLVLVVNSSIGLCMSWDDCSAPNHEVEHGTLRQVSDGIDD